MRFNIIDIAVKVAAAIFIISVIAVATSYNPDDHLLPQNKLDEIAHFRERDIKMGIYDMKPETRARSKVTVYYSDDDFETY